MSIFTKPSFWTLPITGIIVLFVVIELFYNKDEINNLSTSNFIMIVLLLGILIGIHGLLHLGLEISYKFNPIENLNI